MADSVNITSEKALSAPAEGAEFSVSFNASTAWTAETGANFVSVAPARGEAGNVTVTVTVAANEQTETRDASVTFKAGKASASITVSQAAAEAAKSLTASIENYAGDETIELAWTGKEELCVVTSGGEMHKFTATESGKTSTISNGGEFNAQAAYAMYPFRSDVKLNGTTASVTIPAVQTYTAGGFNPDLHLAVGKFDGSEVSLKNVFSIVKLSISGNATVSKVVLKDPETPISGSFSIDVNSNDPKAVYAGNNKTGADYTLTLECNPAVTLGATATDFYFIVPAGSFKTGYVAEVCKEMGHPVKVLITPDNCNLGRSGLKAVKATDANAFSAAGYTEVECLISSGSSDSGQYIDTGLMPSPNKDMDFNVVFVNSKISQRNHVLSTSRKYDGKTNYYYILYQDGSNNRVSMGTDQTYNWQTINENQKYDGHHRVKIGSSSFYSFTEGAYTSGKCTFTKVPEANFLMFTCNYYGSNGPKYYSTGSIYSVYITEDYKLVRNFIPCKRDADSEGGMYDIVNGVFYPNLGTGAFTYPASDNVVLPTNSSECFDRDNNIGW